MTDQPVTPDREALEFIRRLHWRTTYADGPFKGEPCCGCCTWLDGIRRPWPCDTLRALDALLPLLTDALDRARQQGKREGCEQLQAEQRAEADEVMALVHDGTLKKATTTAIERYRQEGREEAAEAIEAAVVRRPVDPDETVTARTMRQIHAEWDMEAARLARGADRKAAG